MSGVPDIAQRGVLGRTPMSKDNSRRDQNNQPSDSPQLQKFSPAKALDSLQVERWHLPGEAAPRRHVELR
jgi:hypothetical protein